MSRGDSIVYVENDRSTFRMLQRDKSLILPPKIALQGPIEYHRVGYFTFSCRWRCGSGQGRKDARQTVPVGTIMLRAFWPQEARSFRASLIIPFPQHMLFIDERVNFCFLCIFQPHMPSALHCRDAYMH